jgi:hypothetical protein
MSECSSKTLHGSMHAMDSEAYFAGALNYKRKMFIKLNTNHQSTS